MSLSNRTLRASKAKISLHELRKILSDRPVVCGATFLRLPCSTPRRIAASEWVGTWPLRIGYAVQFIGNRAGRKARQMK
jgi:hypothetical protein